MAISGGCNVLLLLLEKCGFIIERISKHPWPLGALVPFPRSPAGHAAWQVEHLRLDLPVWSGPLGRGRGPATVLSVVSGLSRCFAGCVWR